tara:strand:+ start:2332 stop:2610 length:279 start_codon:yes stop_codon:yes gene_type:complete
MTEQTYSKESLQTWSTINLGFFYSQLYIGENDPSQLEVVTEVLKNREYDETLPIYLRMCEEMDMYLKMGNKGTAFIVKEMKDQFLDNVINSE